MSVRGTLGGVFAAAAVLIVGWQAGANATSGSTATGTTTSRTTPTASGSTTARATASPTPAAAAPTSPSAASGSSLVDGAYTGETVATRFGPVQVSVTISGGRVADVAALQLTNDSPRSEQISNRAAPVLHDEVVAAQSAQVSYVSGATYTSDAYLASVQSALDQAGG